MEIKLFLPHGVLFVCLPLVCLILQLGRLKKYQICLPHQRSAGGDKKERR